MQICEIRAICGKKIVDKKQSAPHIKQSKMKIQLSGVKNMLYLKASKESVCIHRKYQ